MNADNPIRRTKKWLLAAMVLLALGVGGAWGHGRVHFGFSSGPWPGFWDPWPFDYYPSRPIYYLPPPVIIQQAPPVYIEQPSAPVPQQYWYYCAATRGYYPSVKTCPGGWIPVLPETP